MAACGIDPGLLGDLRVPRIERSGPPAVANWRATPLPNR
jgi:hypothetical protein